MKIKSVKVKKASKNATTETTAAVEPVAEMETEVESNPIETATNGTVDSEAKPKKKVKKDKKVKNKETEEGKEKSTENVAEKAKEESTEKKIKAGKEYSIFIANLPSTVKKSELRAMFNKYGTIKTTRFRTNDGQKIFFNKDKLQVPSLNAYVRFSSKEEMEKACEMNGQMVGEHRIRVCPGSKKQIGDVKSTVFVGNIRRGTTENELYDFFGQIGPIEFIRLIPLKFIAYVCFKKGVSMKRVLKMDQQKLNNRPLRIQPVDTKRTNVKVNKKGNLVKRRKSSKPQNTSSGDAAQAKESNDGKAQDDFHGNVSETANKKKNKRSKSGVGSAKHKKMLANKLKAAMNTA
uniref:RRM domain-containing protein n=1 Tax=Anopheles minimus TaxID=112268 RepID=A0A182VXG3_9DIPT